MGAGSSVSRVSRLGQREEGAGGVVAVGHAARQVQAQLPGADCV